MKKSNKKYENEVYKKLLETIDGLSFGFPKSRLGSDKKLIKTIFTLEDAEDYIKMTDQWMNAKEYAEKNNLSMEEATSKLERMAGKGLVFRRHRDPDQYKQFPFVLGFLEFQVKNATQDTLTHTAIYMISSKFGSRMSQTMPFYRTIPFKKELVEGSCVMPYDDIDAILNRHTKFAVAECLCRKMYKMKPFNKCHHPMETCITTDDFATFYIENGIGREISKEEARAILMEGEKDGRVINVTNSQDGENICSCCKCGCGMLYLKTKYPGPSGDFWSNYYCDCDTSKCVKCGACVNNCPFGYIKKDKKGNIVVDTKNCLGCGICASKCPSKALHLKAKENQYEPPVTYDDAIEVWKNTTKKDYKHFK